jgi:uncharacterized damage-inducible protein DinB
MTPSLAARLARMELRRASLLEELAALGPDQLTFRPGPESWSPRDVLEHLVLVEEAVQRYASKRPGPQPRAATARAGLKLRIILIYFRLGARIEAPTRAVLPAGTGSLEDLRTRWDQARQGLATLLEGETAADRRRPLLRHPVTGWLTPAQSLTFIEAHIAHHRRQIARIRALPGFPPAPPRASA